MELLAMQGLALGSTKTKAKVACRKSRLLLEFPREPSLKLAHAQKDRSVLSVLVSGTDVPAGSTRKFLLKQVSLVVFFIVVPSTKASSVVQWLLLGL